MVLCCNICGNKATVMLDLDCGRFDDHLYFCEKHKPRKVKFYELDEKQGKAKKFVLSELHDE